MFSPDVAELRALRAAPKLAFDPSKPFAPQSEAIRAKLRELLGSMPEKVDPAPVTEYVRDEGSYVEERVLFWVEEGVRAAALLCVPKNHKAKMPLAVCVQGHGTGMHTSVGRTLPGHKPDDGDRDVALHAIENGFAAICIDQRGMGERRTVLGGDPDDGGYPRCHVTAMNALLVGRTMIGLRCWDVSRAIDLALSRMDVDPEKIYITGNSGGGTTSVYAACLDERIALAVPSCALCGYPESIGAMPHCVCNFIPHIAEYMDMGDLAAAIAPRKLVLVHGKEDPIFPEAGVLRAYDTIQRIYAAAGVPGSCRRAMGSGGHRYYKKEAWEAIRELCPDWF